MVFIGNLFVLRHIKRYCCFRQCAFFYCFLIIFALSCYPGASNKIFAQGNSFYNRNLITDDYKRCTTAIDYFEHVYELPPNLLYTINVIESGVSHKNYLLPVPHPWSLNVSGRTYFFDTQREALRYLNKIIANGITNVDIGCSQINYRAHGEKFGYSTARMMNPRHNVEYAARLLRLHLSNVGGDWIKAVGRYHSCAFIHNKKYTDKFIKVWKVLNGNTLNTKVLNKQLIVAKNCEYLYV